MAPTVYPLAAQAALEALFPDTPSIQAVDSGYSFGDADEFADALTDLIGDLVAITSPDYTNGVLTGDDVTITGLTPGDHIAAFVVLNDTGTPATSRIVGFCDQAPGGGAIDYTAAGTTEVVSFPALTIVRL